MDRSRTSRRALSGAVAALALTLTAGCSAGFDATSVQPYAPSDGILADQGDIRVLNALVVSSDAGRAGVVSMTVANRGRAGDRITEISTPDATVSVDTPVELPAGGAVTFGAPDGPTATLTDVTKLPGETITLKLSFAGTQPVTLRTVVVPAEGYYASLTPEPTVAPSP